MMRGRRESVPRRRPRDSECTPLGWPRSAWWRTGAQGSVRAAATAHAAASAGSPRLAARRGSPARSFAGSRRPCGAVSGRASRWHVRHWRQRDIPHIRQRRRGSGANCIPLYITGRGFPLGGGRGPQCGTREGRSGQRRRAPSRRGVVLLARARGRVVPIGGRVPGGGRAVGRGPGQQGGHGPPLLLVQLAVPGEVRAALAAHVPVCRGHRALWPARVGWSALFVRADLETQPFKRLHGRSQPTGARTRRAGRHSIPTRLIRGSARRDAAVGAPLRRGEPVSLVR